MLPSTPLLLLLALPALLLVAVADARVRPSPPTPRTPLPSPPPPVPFPFPPPLVNITGWGVTLPLDQNFTLSGKQGTAISIDPIGNFTLAPYFYYTANATVLRAPANGAVTNSATDPRCEMHYLGEPRWDGTKVSGTLTATVSIDEVPFRTDLNTSGKVIFAQVKSDGSYAGELMKLTYDGAARSLYIEESPPGNVSSSQGYHRLTLVNKLGKPPSIPLRAPFDYIIKTNTSHLNVTVTFNAAQYSALAPIGAYWATAQLWFKTGCYSQGSALPGAPHPGRGAGQVSIYRLSAPTHP